MQQRLGSAVVRLAMLRARVARAWLLAVAAWVVLAGQAWASVSPPLDLQVQWRTATASDGSIQLDIAVTVPAYRGQREASLRVQLAADAPAQAMGVSSWQVSPVVPGQTYRFQAAARVLGKGATARVGALSVNASTLDAAERQLWGRSEQVFLKNGREGLVVSASSPLEVERRELALRQAAGRLDAGSAARALRGMTEAVAAPPARTGTIAAVFDTVAVNGTARYTHRTGWTAAGGNTYAPAASARAIQGAAVRFFDSNGGVETPLASVPASVVTSSTGAYSASVPGKRADGTAVNLVVRVSANTTAATIGPIGVGANANLAYSAVSPPALLDAASKTINLTVDSSNDTVLRAFALREALQTAHSYVLASISRTGVGATPATIYVEFPGTSATGSFFSPNNGDHLNIGLNHAFDWDVLTHEYGHYVQKLNSITANPGGRHFICNNGTGLVQPLSDGTTRTLTKDQGTKLAWGEGWPTYFGTTLQIAQSVRDFGIHGAGDVIYLDTANRFSYDLEANSDRCLGAGEDSELSVQRILWDMADGPQDGNDSVVFGPDEIWRRTVGNTKPLTLDQFRAAIDTIVPASPSGYSTGSLNQNRVKYGRIYADHNVGPVPLAPPDNFVSATPPQFQWETRGANANPAPGSAPGYRFNKFRVVFWNKDYSTVVFTSPEIPTAAGAVAADGRTATWTPTAAEWQTILAGDSLMHWAVQGSGDSPAPATGPYLGQDRTLGGLDIVFVIDDTGSMANDIAGVRQGLTNFITQLAARNLPVNPAIEVITFKDNVTRRTVSRDLAQIQAVVNSLSASGGGDCPEASAQALLEAANDLPASGGGATIIFATDASPHAGFDLAGIQAQLRAKGIAITNLLTGDCVSTSSASRDAEKARAVLAGMGLQPVLPQASANPGSRLAPRALTTAPGSLLWPEDVICPACDLGPGAGPYFSADILKQVGDFSLPTPSAIVSVAGITNASPKGSFLYLPEVKQGVLTNFSNALTNAALGAVAPTVISAQPLLGYAGSRMAVTITGGRTNFSAASVVSFGSGITVNSITPLGATQLVVDISVAPNAANGPRSISVTTPLGAGVVETATGTNQFSVGTTLTALVSSVQPAQLGRGTTQVLQVYGTNTSFDNSSVLQLSAPGVTVGSLVVESPTKLRVELSASPTASLGFRPFSVRTGAQVASFGPGLLVVDNVAAPPSLPVITSVTPASGSRGQSGLLVTVQGSNTSFLAGETIGRFSGEGIEVVNTRVNSQTEAVLTVNIAPTAALGFRDVLLVTGSQTAVRVAGFQVQGTLTCDLNSDGRVDSTDINIILGLRNQPASVNPLADVNGDGVINTLDARICSAQCTRPGCAP